MPNVLSPWDLVSRPDNTDETVTHPSELSKGEINQITDLFGIYEVLF